jgi:uncharacterized Zn-finger protein
MDDIDLSFNAEAVCPYCGYVEENSLEIFHYDDGDGAKTEHTCDNCDEEYDVTLNIEHTFTTRKKEEE